MYLCDVRGSIAYSKALLKVGIVSEHEQSEIERGLGLVAKEWEEKRVRPGVIGSLRESPSHDRLLFCAAVRACP